MWFLSSIMNNIEEIKKLRKKHGLNQHDLAIAAGVSQSLIAKIESGQVDPTYTKARSIFQALERLQQRDELKAKQIMSKKISFVNVQDSLKDVVKIMKSKGISQVPVMSGEKVCGIITERVILNKVLTQPGSAENLKAGDIMDDAPPIVSLSMGFRSLSELLKNYAILLVAEKGDVKGVVSKADLLEQI